nr:gag pol polyprotein [Hymenolepis microstoma]
MVSSNAFTGSSNQQSSLLPPVSIESTIKEDLGCCQAELLLGTTLRLPGGIIYDAQDRASVDPSSYSARLKEHFRFVLLTPAHAVKKPLQLPYDGPYKVLQRKSKFFILDRNGTKDSVSIDGLKLAYLESPPKLALAVRTQRPNPTTQRAEFTVPPPPPPPITILFR